MSTNTFVVLELLRTGVPALPEQWWPRARGSFDYCKGYAAGSNKELEVAYAKYDSLGFVSYLHYENLQLLEKGVW